MPTPNPTAFSGLTDTKAPSPPSLISEITPQPHFVVSSTIVHDPIASLANPTTEDPTGSPTTGTPTDNPTITHAPTNEPTTRHPSASPTTSEPTDNPSPAPTNKPSSAPTPTVTNDAQIVYDGTAAPTSSNAEAGQLSFWNQTFGYGLKFVLVVVCMILLLCCGLLGVWFWLRRRRMKREVEISSPISTLPLLSSEEVVELDNHILAARLSDQPGAADTPLQDDNDETQGEENKSVSMNENKEMDEGDMEIEDMFNGDSISDKKTPHNAVQGKNNERESVVMHVHDTGKGNKESVSIIGNVRDTDP